MKALLRNLKNNRRGAALEMAILLLVVVVALSTLVLSTSWLQYAQMEKAKAQLPRTVALEQIGEAFCAAAAAGTDPGEWSANYPEYKITVDGLTLTVCEKDSDAVLMTVVLTNEDGKYTVVQWNCN